MSMRKMAVLSAAFIMLVAVFKSNTVFAQGTYDLEIIAETGGSCGRGDSGCPRAGAVDQ